MMAEQSSAISVQKTEHGIPIRNLWYMLLYAWNETPLSPYWKMVDSDDSPSLDALLASVLSRTIQQRLRIGLGCNYVPEQRLLRGICGRIDITKSIKQRSFERGQAFCRFEEFSINAPMNQVQRLRRVRAGLHRPGLQCPAHDRQGRKYHSQIPRRL